MVVDDVRERVKKNNERKKTERKKNGRTERNSGSIFSLSVFWQPSMRQQDICKQFLVKINKTEKVKVNFHLVFVS